MKKIVVTNKKTTGKEFVSQVKELLGFFVSDPDEILEGEINFRFDEDFNKIINIKLKAGLGLNEPNS